MFALYYPQGGRLSQLKSYVDARDQLGLVVTDGGTLPLAARVDLISEWGPAKQIIHVSIKDERFWRQHRH